MDAGERGVELEVLSVKILFEKPCHFSSWLFFELIKDVRYMKQHAVLTKSTCILEIF